MREYLSVLMPLLEQGNVSFDGDLYRVHAPLDRGDDAPRPPVVLAAMAPVMLRLAGEMADGTTLWMTGPKTVEQHVVPRINRAAEAAGRPAPHIYVSLPIAVTENADALREEAATTFATYGGLPSYRAMLDEEGAAGPADVAIIGDEETVAAGVRAVANAGATQFNASCFGDGDTVRRTTNLLQELRKEHKS
jgi:F420-dependent oxidoreductase-like protein